MMTLQVSRIVVRVEFSCGCIECQQVRGPSTAATSWGHCCSKHRQDIETVKKAAAKEVHSLTKEPVT